MDLEVLNLLLDNPSYIEDRANDADVDSDASIGIIKKLIGRKGDYSSFGYKEMYHFNNVIKPLIEQVHCEGVIGMIEDDNGDWVSSCSGDGFIDEESLLMSYQEEDFKCQICRFDADKA